MLKRFELENFKGIKKAEIDFGLITVLIGPNGTGKSSIGQALMLLRQSIRQNQLLINGPLLNLGSFPDILSKDSPKKEVGVTVTCEVSSACNSLHIPSGSLFSYQVCFDPAVTSFDASITCEKNRKRLSLKRSSGRLLVSPDTTLVPPSSGAPTDPPISVSFSAANSIARPISFSLTIPGSQESMRQAVEKEMSGLLSTIENALASIYYVPAIRGIDMPNYGLRDDLKIDFPATDNGQLASTFAYSGRNIEKTISHWSKSITGSELSAVVMPKKNVTVMSYAVPEGIPVIDDGSGTNQLVRLLLTLAIAPENSTIIVEEPEIHLHPNAQRKLCSILLEEAESHNKQLLITTHSETILYAFTNAIRNGQLEQDKLAVYNFPQKGKEPCRLQHDEFGDIYGWSKKYFDFPE